MASKKTQDKKHSVKPLHDEIIYTLDDIMSDRFSRYAKYIIQERALPDARDGLKPVQRRILFAMQALNLTHNTSYKKAARVVGEVIGKFHPHGDSSVYEALVRLSQNWKVRYPLIDMHGNNGSIDGDSPAAMRYTETRLSYLASFLLQDLDKETVSYAPNFDDSEIEPVVLPAMFPNLLVNGASGIAAGYATNMPPHNLQEVVNATIHRIKHPDCKLKDLLKYIHGPDFPTGGIIQGVDGIREAYETGRGKIIVRGKIEQGLNQLIISEIPYEVIKQDLVKKIDDIRFNQPGLNIKEVRDETDRTGMRIVVDLQKDANFEVVRKYLLKNTNLQISYNFNMVSIIDKQPRQTGLITLLDSYIQHQQEVITNRSKYQLAKAKNRLEVVEGLIKAISILDEIIKVIRGSKDRMDAINNLIARFQFSKLQAEAIVQLRLYRLTSTDINLLIAEKENLLLEIAKLESILKNRDVLNSTIIEQLQAIVKIFGDNRRSFIEDDIEQIEVEKLDTIVEKMVNIWISRDGYIKMFDNTQMAKVSLPELTRKPNDIFVANFSTLTTNNLLLITSNGNYVIVPVYKIKQSRLRDIGEHVNTIAQLDGSAKIIACIVLNNFDHPDLSVAMCTKMGAIKRTAIRDFEATRISKAISGMKLKGAEDELVGACLVKPDDEIAIISHHGFAVKYAISDISELGLKTSGVKAMNLKGDDYVVGMGNVNQRNLILMSDNNGVKKMKPDQLEMSLRPSRGVMLFKKGRNKIQDYIAYALFARESDILNTLNRSDEINQITVNSLGYVKMTQPFSYFDTQNLLACVVNYHYDLVRPSGTGGSNQQSKSNFKLADNLITSGTGNVVKPRAEKIKLTVEKKDVKKEQELEEATVNPKPTVHQNVKSTTKVNRQSDVTILTFDDTNIDKEKIQNTQSMSQPSLFDDMFDEPKSENNDQKSISEQKKSIFDRIENKK